MTGWTLDPAREALEWLIRQRDPAFRDWEAFTEWLEADSANASCYANLMAIEGEVADAVATSMPPAGKITSPIENKSGYRKWRPIAFAGLAATVAAFFLHPLWKDSGYDVITGAGERKHLLLSDGSRIVLNQRTRIRLDHAAPRSATLVNGEALFDIVHDDRQRFRVSFEGGAVENIGTRFVIFHRADKLEISVAEGAVALERGGGMNRINAGQRLVDQNGHVLIHPVVADRLAGWATPRLTYENAPLAAVAVDLSRELGVPVTVAPDVAAMRISATIHLDPDVERSMARLGPLLGIKVNREDEGWRFSSVR